MKNHGLIVSALAAGFLFIANLGYTEVPTPPVTGNTLWHWLGIPQGCNKIKDARLNRSGDRPDRERQPPLKRIADPANLESQNPAIKAAAKIKAEEDLAPQKIKAIKYLGTVGCGCYPGVRESLLAALDDCTEEVRYEAAIALCQVAGNPCKNCDKSGCCNAEVMNKLNDVANGQDAKGCFKESSSRVRAAATNAMNACRRKNPTTSMQPIPEKGKELPIEGTQPGTKELPTEPGSQGPVPTPAAPKAPEDNVPSPAATLTPLYHSGTAKHAPSSGQIHLTGLSREEGVAEASDSSPVVSSTAANPNTAGVAEQVAFLRGGRRCPPCPQQQICPEQPRPYAPETVKPGEKPMPPAPGEKAPSEIAGESNVPPTNALASNYGATSGPLSSAPNMIGDFFGMTGITIITPEGSGLAPLPGNAVPRYKMAEQTNPMPQDRVFFDYDFFKNVPLTVPSVDVNAYVPGFEKTFLDGWTSVEVRAPIASSLNSDFFFDGSTSTATGQVGNMGLTFKALLVRRERFALSGGLAMTLPTASNGQFFGQQGSTNPAMVIDNQAVHLMPFIGTVWTSSNERWFASSYLQIDVDANGDPVTGFNNDSTTPIPDFIGRYRDMTFLYADLSVGYWARHTSDPSKFLTGLALVTEFHMNQSLETANVLRADGFQVGTPGQTVSVFDITAGVHLELCKLTTVTAAYCVPVSTNDQQFDGQLRLLFNRRF